MPPFVEPPLPEVIRRIANSADCHLAWEFFVFFSRFEYALKRHERYLMPGVGNAEPNWDRFASDYNAEFSPDTTPTLAAAIQYYLDKPPMKQLRADGKMKWSDPITLQHNGPLLVWLLLAVRVVRNNLFHGGKFPLIAISDPSRDRELLANAITILATCLPLDPQVNSWFMEGIDE
jgi:hypothetical protein